MSDENFDLSELMSIETCLRSAIRQLTEINQVLKSNEVAARRILTLLKQDPIARNHSIAPKQRKQLNLDDLHRLVCASLDQLEQNAPEKKDAVQPARRWQLLEIERLKSRGADSLQL